MTLSISDYRRDLYEMRRRYLEEWKLRKKLERTRVRGLDTKEAGTNQQNRFGQILKFDAGNGRSGC
jgi:hypothetical protein